MTSFSNYESARAYGNAMEERKRPGQKFCDKVGYKLKINGFIEIQRPDKITFIGGTIYRTITPVYHVWYKKGDTGEHILIEFSGNICTVKRNVAVDQSPGCGFNKVNLHIKPDNYSSIINFYSYEDTLNYLLGI